MLTFQKNSPAEKLLNDLCKSYEIGEKRDLLTDAKKFLKINKIKFSVSFKQSKLADTPTIVMSNHYKRSFFERKSTLTTVDSMVTSALITVCLSKITQRKTSWVIKNNLIKNILFYDFKPRVMQMAVIKNYDSIGVSSNYPFARKDKWLERLKSGYNIVLYPEGVISTKLKKPQKGFATILKYLKENHLKVQILPLGIYTEQGAFKLNFGKVLYPVGLKNVQNEVMFKIAESLPLHLRGPYSFYPKSQQVHRVQVR